MAPPRFVLACVAIGSVLAVAGCAPEPPAPTPSASVVVEAPSATPTPAPSAPPAPPVPASIVIDGDSVSVTASGGGTIVDLPFTTDPAEATERLATAIGEAADSQDVPAGPCSKAMVESDWGGIHLYSPYPNGPAGALFYVTVDGPATDAGLAITIPSGQAIGASGDAVQDANIEAPAEDAGGWINVYYDVKNGHLDDNPDEFYGAYLQIKDDELAFFSSPIHYLYDC